MKSILPYLCIAAGFLFASLFYRQLLGLNLLIFELVLIGLSLLVQKPSKNNYSALIVLAGTIISAVFVVLYGSAVAKTINIISFTLLMGYRLYDSIRSPFFSFIQGISVLVLAPWLWCRTLSHTVKTGSNKNRRKVLRYIKLIVVPVLIIVVFIFIYRIANPRFDTMILNLFEPIVRFFRHIMVYINIGYLLLALAGSCIAVTYLLFNKKAVVVPAADASLSDALTRAGMKKAKFTGKMTDLKKEYKAAVFMLAALNILILVINIIDIDWVWLNFTWDGSILKQFVHEGTYMLVIAVILSIVISLFVFRKNLNFLSGNKIIRYLAYIWLAQNALMLVSVAIRNLRYIEHFNLAHKRIGLFFFLLAVLWLIIVVVLKIEKRRSAYYAVRTTGIGTYIILLVMCSADWDLIIVKYNFSHAQTAFLHRDWMVTLSDKALPVMETRKDLLDAPITSESWHRGGGYKNYLEILEKRKAVFLSEYPKRHILSFNLADYQTYRQLSHAD